jgi:uncharacterized protein (DUF983 family)
LAENAWSAGFRTGLVAAPDASASFGIYLVGIILVIAGFVYAAALLNLPTHWIVVAALVMLGIGVVTAVKSTRQRDPAK